MANWFHCDDATGAIISGGIATEEDAALQTPPEGQSLFVVADGVIGAPYSPTPDFSALKVQLCAKVDGEAGAVRIRYITDVPGQPQTYEKKEIEARSWQSGDPDGDYPFMSVEAAVRGVPIEQVRNEILAQVNALTPLAALIEAHRIAAKQAIADAEDLPSIVGAAAVDWEAVLP